MKRDTKELDSGQLELMWDMLRMKPKCECTVEDVEGLEYQLDKIRQILIQKTDGRQRNDKKHYVNFDDIGTHINLVVINALAVYINGGLSVLKDVLKGERE